MNKQPSSPEREFDDEVRFHVEGRIDEFVTAGLTQREARQRALAQFGDVARIKADCSAGLERAYPRKRGQSLMHQFVHDFRYAVRTLRKHPTYAAAVIATLTLAIGATTAVFSVVKGVLLEPLPLPEPQQVVRIWEVDQRPGFFDDRNRVAVANYGDWRTQNTVFTEMAAFQESRFTLRGRGDPRPIQAGVVTAEFFEVLGVRAFMGRTFFPTDDDQDAESTLILSYNFWVREFGSDPDIIGKTLSIGSGTFPVIGVLPESFDFLEADVWGPLRVLPSAFGNRRSHIIDVMARMNPGVTVEEAQRDMDRIVSGLTPLYPSFLDGWGINVMSLTDSIVGDVRPALLVLQGAVVVLLIIAIVNVTNLMFARTTSEQRELAIRTALGAGRKRLVSQKVGEALVLAALGGAGGVTLALGLIRLLLTLAPVSIPMIDEVRIDLPIMLFAVLVTTVSALAFSFAPALQAGRTELANTMNTRGGSVHRRHAAVRSALVVAQLAFSLTLLISAGLLVNTFVRLMRVDPGFDASQITTMRVSIPRPSYPASADQARFFEDLLARIQNLPGVRNAGATRFLPLVDTEWTWSVQIQGQPEPLEGEKRDYGRHAVAANYFQTMNVALREGRYFNNLDRSDGRLTMIVNEAFVNRFLPGGEPPVGRIMTILGEDEPIEIVGVVADVRHYALDIEPQPAYYAHLSQVPQQFGFGLTMNVVVRADGDAAPILAASRNIVREMDPTAVVSQATTMQNHVSSSVARSRFAMTLLGTFATIALALAVVGVYGVVSYSVSQRTQEIGVRLALGAKGPTILQQVIGHAMRLALVGVGLGVITAMVVTRFQSSLLYEVSALDPLTYGALSLTLVLAAGAAAFVPALRASRTDPIFVLREE